MTLNVGSAERVIRVLVGVVWLALVVVGPQTWWGLIGVVPIATALAGWCPIWSALGISTRKETVIPGGR
ncbi:MAG: DUF2892 domain-containing protein [Candidatus Rokuibacteriota bacterium]